MAHNSAFAEFKQGITLLRNGHSAEALEYLQHAKELEQRFFYIKTLKKTWSIAETPYPKKAFHLPSILSREQVARLSPR
jgi:hypothetical protein